MFNRKMRFKNGARVWGCPRGSASGLRQRDAVPLESHHLRRCPWAVRLPGIPFSLSAAAPLRATAKYDWAVWDTVRPLLNAVGIRPVTMPRKSKRGHPRGEETWCASPFLTGRERLRAAGLFLLNSTYIIGRGSCRCTACGGGRRGVRNAFQNRCRRK